MQVTNSLDIKLLAYEKQKLHKKRIAGETVHLVSRYARKRLSSTGLRARLWKYKLRITKLAHRRTVR